MNITRKTICNDTAYVIEQYYHLNLQPLLSILSDDCVWLMPGNKIVYGAKAIRAEFKDGFVMPEFDMENIMMQEIETGKEDLCTVLGTYMLTPSANATAICSAEQRVTFYYRLEEEYYRLFRMHVSNAWSELVDDEVFPFQISKQSYQYVQKLIAQKSKHTRNRLTIEKGNKFHQIYTDSIVYIEALDKKSILHTVDGSKVIDLSIKEFENNLPKSFYRIHRSHLVNCAYVMEIQTYKAIMATGVQLPIPKQRFVSVKENIKERCVIRE